MLRATTARYSCAARTISLYPTTQPEAAVLTCATKLAVRVYTFNVKDFRALASSELAGRITAP